MAVLVGAAEWSDAKRAADAYGAVLARHAGLFQSTPLDEQTQNDWLALFQQHRLTLLTAPQETQLRQETPQFWRDSALSQLYSPFGGPKLGAWQDDPFGLFGGWVQERAQETPVRPRDGHLFVADGERQYVLLPMTLSLPAFSLGAQESVLPALAQAGERRQGQAHVADDGGQQGQAQARQQTAQQGARIERRVGAQAIA